jgi:hypothetical protein
MFCVPMAPTMRPTPGVPLGPAIRVIRVIRGQQNTLRLPANNANFREWGTLSRSPRNENNSILEDAFLHFSLSGGSSPLKLVLAS